MTIHAINELTKTTYRFRYLVLSAYVLDCTYCLLNSFRRVVLSIDLFIQLYFMFKL